MKESQGSSMEDEEQRKEANSMTCVLPNAVINIQMVPIVGQKNVSLSLQPEEINVTHSSKDDHWPLFSRFPQFR